MLTDSVGQEFTQDTVGVACVPQSQVSVGNDSGGDSNVSGDCLTNMPGT